MILHVTNRLATVTKGANRVTLMTTAAKVKKKPKCTCNCIKRLFSVTFDCNFNNALTVIVVLNWIISNLT